MSNTTSASRATIKGNVLIMPRAAKPTTRPKPAPRIS